MRDPGFLDYDFRDHVRNEVKIYVISSVRLGLKKMKKKNKNKIQTVVIIITRNENIKYNKRRFVFSRRRSIILCAEEMTRKKHNIYCMYAILSLSLYTNNIYIFIFGI